MGAPGRQRRQRRHQLHPAMEGNRRRGVQRYRAARRHHRPHRPPPHHRPTSPPVRATPCGCTPSRRSATASAPRPPPSRAVPANSRTSASTPAAAMWSKQNTSTSARTVSPCCGTRPPTAPVSSPATTYSGDAQGANGARTRTNHGSVTLTDGAATSHVVEPTSLSSVVEARIRPLSEDLSGPWSKVQYFLPGKPTALRNASVTYDADAGQFNYSWEPPRFTGGGPMVGYYLVLEHCTNGCFGVGIGQFYVDLHLGPEAEVLYHRQDGRGRIRVLGQDVRDRPTRTPTAPPGRSGGR